MTEIFSQSLVASKWPVPGEQHEKWAEKKYRGPETEYQGGGGNLQK